MLAGANSAQMDLAGVIGHYRTQRQSHRDTEGPPHGILSITWPGPNHWQLQKLSVEDTRLHRKATIGNCPLRPHKCSRMQAFRLTSCKPTNMLLKTALPIHLIQHVCRWPRQLPETTCTVISPVLDGHVQSTQSRIADAP